MAVNAAGNYTQPKMRAALFRRIKASGKGWKTRAMVCTKGTDVSQTI